VRRLVFLDEFGTHTKLTRLCGKAFRSQRVVDHVLHGHWKTTTFVGALRLTGFTAPAIVDDPMLIETASRHDLLRRDLPAM
jgi:hypothetical protein